MHKLYVCKLTALVYAFVVNLSIVELLFSDEFLADGAMYWMVGHGSILFKPNNSHKVGGGNNLVLSLLGVDTPPVKPKHSTCYLPLSLSSCSPSHPSVTSPTSSTSVTLFMYSQLIHKGRYTSDY